MYVKQNWTTWICLGKLCRLLRCVSKPGIQLVAFWFIGPSNHHDRNKARACYDSNFVALTIFCFKRIIHYKQTKQTEKNINPCVVSSLTHFLSIDFIQWLRSGKASALYKWSEGQVRTAPNSHCRKYYYGCCSILMTRSKGIFAWNDVISILLLFTSKFRKNWNFKMNLGFIWIALWSSSSYFSIIIPLFLTLKLQMASFWKKNNF